MPGVFSSIKQAVRGMAARFGYEVRNIREQQNIPAIPDRELYKPLFSPWLSRDFDRYYCLAEPRTLVSRDRCYVLATLLQQAISLEGDVCECGVYRGGTAAMLAQVLADNDAGKRFYLFDTFAGMPETDAERDLHKRGDFAETSAEQVASFVGHPDIVTLRPGFIPSTFVGLESARFCFAHVDVDIYRSILDSLEFLWPRLSRGGFVVFDDYGFPSCPGARQSVDEFFAATGVKPLCLSTGQAIAFKS